MKTLKQHIDSEHVGSQSAFARKNGIKRQQVTVWIRKGFIVHDGKLYSFRRKLK